MKISEVLDRTVGLLEQGRWVQWNSGRGPTMCLESALSIAISGDTRTFRDLCSGLNETEPARFLAAYIGTDKHLHYWNDTEGRTREEVIETVRGAADSARWMEEASAAPIVRLWRRVRGKQAQPQAAAWVDEAIAQIMADHEADQAARLKRMREGTYVGVTLP